MASLVVCRASTSYGSSWLYVSSVRLGETWLRCLQLSRPPFENESDCVDRCRCSPREGRLSAWILGLLPVVFALYLVVVRPGYLEPLITTVFGWIMVGSGLLLLAIGGLWLRKVVKVEV